MSFIPWIDESLKKKLTIQISTPLEYKTSTLFQIDSTVNAQILWGHCTQAGPYLAAGCKVRAAGDPFLWRHWSTYSEHVLFYENRPLILSGQSMEAPLKSTYAMKRY